MSAWRLLETWDASPALAMGLDEALLEEPGAPPTLRLYTWSPDTLSLGYFQRFADVPAAARAGEPGGPGAVVRRITGGGAIHHVHELTFSIASPTLRIADHTSVPDNVRGTGVGRALVQRLVDDARAEGFKVVPLCPYVNTERRRHPEWADVFST